jgi:DNA repair exonuclease SbcCD ATPase subunit
VSAADEQRLRAHERSLRRLAEQLARTGFISSGSVVCSSSPCGRPNCRCHADPPQLHGPYWQWSYRPAGGKTVTRKLTEPQARLYQDWIANRRRLLAIVAEMEEVSRLAAEILLARAHDGPAPSPDGLDRLQRPARRVTRQLAEALTQIAELAEPAAEAAQAWLDSKDDEDDPEATAEARHQLLATLDQSAELVTTLHQLARLLGPTPSRP